MLHKVCVWKCIYKCIFVWFIQASPAQKVNKAGSSTADIYDAPGPSTSRRYSSVYLHPDRARLNPIATSSHDHGAAEVFICFNINLKLNGNMIIPFIKYLTGSHHRSTVFNRMIKSKTIIHWKRRIKCLQEILISSWDICVCSIIYIRYALSYMLKNYYYF